MKYEQYLGDLEHNRRSVSEIAEFASEGVLTPALQQDFKEFIERFRQCIDEDQSDFLPLNEEDSKNEKIRFFSRLVSDFVYVNSRSGKKISDFITLLARSALADRVPNLVERARNRLNKIVHGIIPNSEPEYIRAEHITNHGFFSPTQAIVALASTKLESDDVYIHEYFHLVSGAKVSASTSNGPADVQLSFSYYPNCDYSKFYEDGLSNLNEALTEFLTLWLEKYHSVEEEEEDDFAKSKPSFDLEDEFIAYSEQNYSGYKYLVIALVKFASLFKLLARMKRIKTASLENLLLDWYFADENSQEYDRLKSSVDEVFGEDFFVNFINYFGKCYSSNVSESTKKKKRLKLKKLIKTLEECIGDRSVDALSSLIVKPRLH